MKNPRILLAAALALYGAGVIRAQTPPPATNLTPGAPPRTGLDPYPLPPTPPPPGYPLVDQGMVGPPAVAIGDNAVPNVPKMWFNAGWAWSWVTSAPFSSPLLTTSTPADAGLLGAPSTAVLVGQARYSYGTINGGMFGSGGWFNEDRTFGADGSTTWNEQKSLNVYNSSDGSLGSTPLYRPIFDPVTQTETSVPVAIPGVLAGDFLLFQKFNMVNGDSNLMMNVYRDERSSWTLMLGYRLIYIDEQLYMTQDAFGLVDGAISYLGTPLPAGNFLTIVDRIETENRLYLGQLGARWERHFGIIDLGITYKFGFGWADERTFLSGSTTLNPPAPAALGGILIQQSMPFRNQNERFVVVPDLNVHVSMQLIRRLRATFDYHATYISSVARPGDFIDRTVELSQAPSFAGYNGIMGVRPAYHQTDNSLFSQTIIAGLAWEY
jgi:hypothetical protein